MSIATVSRVINAVPYPVSDCTRRPILRAIRKLDSRPNALGRSVHRSTARSIDLLVPDIPNACYAEVTRGIGSGEEDPGQMTRRDRPGRIWS